MERLRALLVHNCEIGDGGGGVSILNYDLAEYLTKNDWDTVLFTPLAKNYKEKTSFHLEWRLKNLEKLVFDSDVVILSPRSSIWKSYSQTLHFCKKYNKPYVIWFHIALDEDIYRHRHGRKNFEETKKFLSEIFNDNLCRKIICISEGVKNLIYDLVENKEKLTVIYPGVKKFEKSFSNIYGDLLYVGRLSEEKNVDLLIKSISILKREFPEVVLNIIGDGPSREKLENLVKKRNLEENIKFLGHLKREEVFPIYQNHKAMILPSKIESLGLVIIEALMNNLPVIVSNTYGPKEIFKDIDYPLFLENFSVEEIVSKMKIVLKNQIKFKEYFSHIKNDILKNFNFEKQMNKLELMLLESFLFNKENLKIRITPYSPIFV